MAIGREIEIRGIPTVVVTVSPEATVQAYPPRALYPAGFRIGHSFGPPFQAELQRKVVGDALQLLITPLEPGTLIQKEYPEYRQDEGQGSRGKGQGDEWNPQRYCQ